MDRLFEGCIAMKSGGGVGDGRSSTFIGLSSLEKVLFSSEISFSIFGICTKFSLCVLAMNSVVVLPRGGQHCFLPKSNDVCLETTALLEVNSAEVDWMRWF